MISTPEGGDITFTLFGTDAGELYYASHGLLEMTPHLVHTFPDDVKCVWINETDRDRCVVGLADGTVWATTDASLVETSTWTELAEFAAPIEWVAESPEQIGQYWVCSGRYLYVSFDNLATSFALATFPEGSTSRKISNSYFGNFVCASVPEGESPVRWADGDQALVMPVLATPIEDVRAITHHLYQPITWFCDVLGRFCRVDSDLSVTLVSTITDTFATIGNVNHMIRDTVNQAVIYVACDNGLLKTYDGGLSWVMLRDYSTAGDTGHMVGVGSLALPVSTPADPSWIRLREPDVEIATISLNLGTGGTPPAGWSDRAFDDSTWDEAAIGLMWHTTRNAMGDDLASFPVWVPEGVAKDQQTLFRRHFTLAYGTVTDATLLYNADDNMDEIWINGTQVLTADAYPGDGGGINSRLVLDPSAVTWYPSEDNVIAIKASNSGSVFLFAWAALTLVINEEV